jgi:esterase/lipase superfamily enzyme
MYGMMTTMKRNDLKLPVTPTLPWATRGVILLTAALFLGGCSSKRPLMPTPDVYALGIKQPFSDSLPAELKTVDANIMYATDRTPTPRKDGRLDYGIGREQSMAFGEAVVNIGGDSSWEKLASDARTGVRSKALNLNVVSVTEKARGPSDSLIYYQADGNLVRTVEGEQKLQAMTSTVYDMIRERLTTAPRNEILLYVHGVKNDFDQSLYTTTELWHYMGREFVPIAYSWPAGRGGLLRGYSYDRESSEFTVFHFKLFLEWLATIPELEGIHIIAHSRGTDVVFTAIRELTIEWRARSETALERFKLRNVVIAAPDINVEVSVQRTEREGTRWTAERWTTYTSARDKAIGISEWLNPGGRFGKAGYDNMDDKARMWAENFAEVDLVSRDSLIEYDGRSGGAYGHDYFRTNPAVASDLILTVRYGQLPGAENGRPLEHIEGLFWKIDDDYLKPLNVK